MKDTKENAIIILESHNSGDDDIKFTANAGFYEKDGTFYITYREHSSMGMGDSRVFLKVEQGAVTMRRMGEFKTVMLYKEGEATDFVYATPFGNIDIKIKTEKIISELSENGGMLEFSYRLFSAGEETKNNIRITVNLQ